VEVPRLNVLSIQSHVAYGHVGNSAAVFALQRLGIEAWPVHTVQFSNHPGYGGFRGRVFDGEAVREVVAGLKELGVLGGCAGVLSGYVGDAGIGAAILDAVARVKRANPAALYCCDPVIGDNGRVYVREGIPEFLRERALAAADIVMPNQFELEFLAGRRSASLREALAAVDALHAMGPRVVLVTSLATVETPADAIDLLASDGGERLRLRTPRLALTASGAGDLLAALFLGRFLQEGSFGRALALAAASVFGVLARTQSDGARELALIAAQEEIARPSRTFAVERL
jgi:pyridoxine kinase